MPRVKAGKQVALSNKEILSRRQIVMPASAQSNVRVLPVDSEHNASTNACAPETKKVQAFGPHCLRRALPEDAARAMAAAARAALAHPKTGGLGAVSPLISATLVNKGFEVIRSALLFDMRPDQIDVVGFIPQSTILRWSNCGMGPFCATRPTDMRMPIQYAQPTRSGLQSN